ncbi:amphiregulin [Zootoca vivipara]|uniref:amphiregulin n=1 Tax=Zootoca vivipara TaxID=8524 RepID=UPI0015926ABA|nr:amphiregulin [Zootoca vivipara]XP_034992994.1 amphiregulin [Zootoca vivipara]
MRATLALLRLLLWSLVCQHAAGSGLNVTEQEQNMPILRTLNTPAAGVFSSGVDYEETEEEEVAMAPQFLAGDSATVAFELKKPAKSESGKKNSNKPKRKGNNKGRKNKKKTPCEAEFKNFCVHGDCKYYEHLRKATCKCHSDYFGERCVEQFLKTHSADGNDVESSTSTILASTAGLLTFAAIGIIVTLLVRKRCSVCDEKEERKRLRQENGSSSNDV